MMAWSVYVELRERDVLDNAREALRERLADNYASVGYATNGNLSVQLSVDAATARQAIDEALKCVSAAARESGISRTVLGVELVSEEELDRRLDEPSIPALVGISEIAELFGVVRQRATQLTRRDDFPPAVAQLKSGPVYVKEQVEAFGKRWARSSGRPPKRLDLTPTERLLLEELAKTARGDVAPSKRAMDVLRAQWEAVDGHLLVRSARHHSPALSALERLVRHKLVHPVDVPESVEEVEQGIIVELTSKGERQASML